MLNQLPWSLFVRQINRNPVLPDSVKDNQVLMHSTEDADDPFLWTSFDEREKSAGLGRNSIPDFDDPLEGFTLPNEVEFTYDNDVVIDDDNCNPNE